MPPCDNSYVHTEHPIVHVRMADTRNVPRGSIQGKLEVNDGSTRLLWEHLYSPKCADQQSLQVIFYVIGPTPQNVTELLVVCVRPTLIVNRSAFATMLV